jgi:dTDP-glucose 4,6-dehydratase
MIEYILDTTDWSIFFTKRPPKEDDRLRIIDSRGRVHEWNGQSMDIILHAAGNASSVSCIADPARAIDDNVTETLRMLEIAREHKVERFVYFSSVEVYGKYGVCHETDMCRATNMYAATKYSGEQLCHAYERSYNLPCSIVRLNNTFGKFCQPERFPVIAVKKLLNQEKFIMYTYDNEIIGRRWTPIEDVAEMVMFIIRREPSGGTYNTTAEFMTNLEFLNHIAKAMKVEQFEYELVEEAINGRMGSQDAPPDLIKSLGWKASKTFEERICDFVQHFLSH